MINLLLHFQHLFFYNWRSNWCVNKKGGLGLPTVTALIIFLTYHFTGTFLKNSAEDGSLNPLIGAWTMTIIITILAMLIFVRANNDKPLINISNLRLGVFIKK